MSGLGIGGRGDWALTTVAPEDDEPAWSHLQRIGILNNLTSIVPLLREWSCIRVPSAHKISYVAARRVQRHLSNAAGQSYELYHRTHGTSCMLIGGAKVPPMYGHIGGANPKEVAFEPEYVIPPCPQVKFCRSCATADVACRGFTWFRRIHQVAGLEFCPVHSERLMQRQSGYSSLLRAYNPTEVRSQESTEHSSDCIALAPGGFKK